MKLVLFFIFLFSSCFSVSKKELADKAFKASAKVFSTIPIMSIDEMKAIRNKENYILVDVRSEKEYSVSMIPGAITKAEFEKKSSDYVDFKIITYCTVGYRSGSYAKELKKRGFDTYNLEGSILGWVHNKGKLIGAEGKPTKKIHVFGSSWNFVPDDYEGVY